jgi:phosphatidylglycerophosphate synthase
MNKIITPTANNNIFVWLLSYFSLPLSKLFNQLRITPNTLTFFSFICIVLGCKELINGNFIFFCSYLIISIILDICDGQVARMSGNVNKSNLDIDHITDVIKISLIFLSFGILINTKFNWIIIFLSSFFYLFYCFIISETKKIHKKNIKKKIRLSKPMFFNYFSLNTFSMIYKIMLPLVITFNCHSLFLFLLILIDLNLINFVLLYFISVYMYRIFKNLILLSGKK